MGGFVSIRDINSLKQLKVTIARFCEQHENLLQTIDSKTQAKIDQLRSLEWNFSRDVEIAREELRDAERSLSRCEDDTYETEEGETIYPDCSSEEDEVRDCRRTLEHHLTRLQSYKAQIRLIEILIAEYQSPKIKYRDLLQFEKEASTNCLQQLINGAEDYMSISTPNLANQGGIGLNLADTIAKVDPTLIVAASVGVAEIITLTVLSFLGASGRSFTISNSNENGVITSNISNNGDENECSKLKIVCTQNGIEARILNINIPSGLENEKIGKHLIENLESISRANDCKEISGWSNTENVGFYSRLGYQTRNEIKGSGAEIFKPLHSNFSFFQNNAKSAFQNTNAINFKNHTGKVDVNPLYIISPEEINDDKFWKQHDSGGIERYLKQVEQYDNCRSQLKSGKTIEEIKKSDFNSAIAYENFISKSDTIRLHKSGEYYKIDGGGRHRVAAAQIYFLKTGRVIPIEAEITESL